MSNLPPRFITTYGFVAQQIRDEVQRHLDYRGKQLLTLAARSAVPSERLAAFLNDGDDLEVHELQALVKELFSFGTELWVAVPIDLTNLERILDEPYSYAPQAQLDAGQHKVVPSPPPAKPIPGPGRSY